MLESSYQAYLIKKLKSIFPGCFVMKNDSAYIQGVPDLTILLPGFWAVLEVKADKNAPERPNQGYYVDLLDHMSFAAFIHPDNEEEVLYALQQAFESSWYSRVV